MKNPRNIQTTQFVKILPADLRPGHVLAYGVLLNKRRYDGGYFLDFPHNTTIFQPESDEAIVLCAVPQEFAERVAESIVERAAL